MRSLANNYCALAGGHSCRRSNGHTRVVEEQFLAVSYVGSLPGASFHGVDEDWLIAFADYAGWQD